MTAANNPENPGHNTSHRYAHYEYHTLEIKHQIISTEIACPKITHILAALHTVFRCSLEKLIVQYIISKSSHQCLALFLHPLPLDHFCELRKFSM